MRTPFLEHTTLAALPPVAVKILLFICAAGEPGRKGTIDASADRLGLSRASWRRHIGPLVEAGLVEYQVSTTGYRARALPTKRFTWVPSFDDDRLEHASPRACKALLAICRALHNQTGTVKMGLAKLAERLGRGVRTALLALAELRSRGILASFRTGRSSWFSVQPPTPDPAAAGDSVAPMVAHRSRLVLRLSLSLPEGVLAKVCQRAEKDKAACASTLRQWTAVRTLTDERRGLRNLMVRMGVLRDYATAWAMTRTPREIEDALSRLTGRTPRHPTRTLARLLRDPGPASRWRSA